MATPKFEIYQSGTQYRWRLKDGNGEIIASGEGYATRANAQRGAENVKSTAPNAIIEDI